MAVVSGNRVLVTPYPEENPRPNQRLGRHQELDGRSLAFAVSEEEAARVQIKPVEWLAPIQTLDQGNLGSCVGNASTYHLGEVVGADNLSRVTINGVTLSRDGDNEQFAVQVYHGATVYDGYPGTYPPEDTGSSGLGACRFLKSLKGIASYTHALSARSVGLLMMHRGTIQGWPWYNAWFEPDAHGFIDSQSNWQQSGLAGGHEIYCEAIEAWDDQSWDRCILRFHNSWGGSWADAGRFRMKMSTYIALQSQVDVKQFRLAA
jgi:hypothetical protein